jgi:signal transduction histidine kinase/CheY-like chemotaxis protein
VSTVFVVGAAMSGVNYVVSRLGIDAIPAVAPTVMVVMLWVGLLLRPRWHFLVALYALCAPLFVGAEFVLSTPSHPEPDMVSLPILLAALAVPVGLNVLLTMSHRSGERRLRDALKQVEDDLRRKAKELEASQEQLVQARKLKVVGTMAAGLAHELNNILTPIRGFAERLVDCNRLEEARRYGRRMLDSTEAAANITDALLTYTRQGSFDPVRTEVGQLLEQSILPLLSKQLPPDISLRANLERDAYVAVDRVLLQQCVANLVNNAAAAMPGGGTIEISLTTRDWEPSLSPTPDLEKAEPVGSVGCVLAVSDSGMGIDPTHIDRIFDPFFTTKGVGGGTGLGLAIVQGIVAMHGGYVTVESTPGKGSTFTLVLPSTVRDGSSVEISPDPEASTTEGRVAIVVTPEQDLLDELEELVAGLGFMPVCTTDAALVDVLLATKASFVQLVVVDLDHPAATGGRLCIRVRERMPQVPIVMLASPEGRSAVVDMLSKPRGVLRKPVDPALFARLATTLASPETRSPSLPRIKAIR